MNIPIPRRLGLLAFLAFAAVPAFASPALIGNKDLANEKIDSPTLKAVFLGKRVSWEGAGERVTLAVLKSGPVAEEFLKGAVDMSPGSFSNYWRRLAMTGCGSPPHFFENEEDLRKFVAETPGAVGFLDSANADASVVVLAPIQ